jgi:hypothetical protein
MLADRAQKTLFPEPIKSIGFDQIDILQDIMTLYCPKGFECDPTYSIGNFYKSHIPQPRYRFDVNPQVPGVIQASADKLPLESESVASINFDPPFVVNRDKTSGIMSKRFDHFTRIEDLYTFYRGALKEFYRILISRGILVFKCQDVVDKANHFSHIEVFNQALSVGFVALDLFVLLSKVRPYVPTKQQRHARKYHSYFWVFQKQSLN